MQKYLIIAALLLLPSLVFGAGFAKQSLFLSKTPVTEGETVLIHAIVSNDAVTKFSGNVVFKDGEQKLGTVAASIAASGASAVSISWKPGPGKHTITAELTQSDGTVVESESVEFTINEKPKPVVIPTLSTSSQTAAAIESSQGIQNQIGSLSPAVADASAPLFTFFDGLRSGVVDVIDSQITKTKANIATTPKPGVVEGSTTSAFALPDTAGSFWNILYTLYLYLLTLLRFVIGNAGIFYPVLALLFLYFLWKMFRRYRRSD